MSGSLDQLLQSFPARAERLSQERLVPFIKQIEDDVGDRKNSCEELNPERGTGLVARQEQPKVRLALAQDHDLAVQDGAGREVAGRGRGLVPAQPPRTNHRAPIFKLPL